MFIDTSGGDGGKGGQGGDGGNGGVGFSGEDARTLYHFRGLDNYTPEILMQISALIGVPELGAVLVIMQIFNGLKIGNGFNGYDGGKGGSGGSGGHGGNGGKAGDIDLVYGKQIDGKKIVIVSKAGAAGAAGVGGRSGIGGQGGAGGKRGDFWSKEGKPGKSGAPGSAGAAGNPGKPGAASTVRWLKNDNPARLSCLLDYQLFRDQGDPLADEILQSCKKM